MRKNILFLWLIFSSLAVYSQDALFKDYDFNSGEYSILGVYSENGPNKLRDSLGEFYTRDISVLNLLKKEWVFNKPTGFYSCGYHYIVYLCKNGEALASYAINIDCDAIVTNKGSFYFNSEKLRILFGTVKKPYSKIYEFKNPDKLRSFRAEIIKDTTLIMAPYPYVMEYEGTFRFTYKCNAGTKDCLDEDHKIFKSIEAEIKKKYPTEKFELSEVGGSWTTLEIMVTCNKSLSDAFNLYERDKKDYFGKWAPFRLKLETYWTKK
jgi:hypothetical protein